jgi:hypothetical protein
MYQIDMLMIPELVPVIGLLLSVSLLIAGLITRSVKMHHAATVFLLLTVMYAFKFFHLNVPFFMSGGLMNTALVLMILASLFCLLILLFPNIKKIVLSLQVLTLLFVLISFDIYMKVANTELSIKQIEELTPNASKVVILQSNLLPIH